MNLQKKIQEGIQQLAKGDFGQNFSFPSVHLIRGYSEFKKQKNGRKN